jgi:outer membrane biosynthesis protein TonB
MKRWQPWNPGAAAPTLGSILAHAAVLALVVLFTGIRPFDSSGAQAIIVDLVTPDEAKLSAPEATKPTTPEPEQPQAKLDLTPPKPAEAPANHAAAEAAKPASEPQQPQPVETPAAQQAAPQPPSQQEAPAERQAAAAPLPLTQPAPAFTPPEPDLTVKYGVMLGLPGASGRSDFDEVASKAAAVPADDITAFRRHLKTCAVMPDSVAATDDVWIKLRAAFRPDGHLAAAPILIEGKASPKALALANGAIAALQACQPYAMLPADKYNEWKVLDLEFSPADFHRG